MGPQLLEGPHWWVLLWSDATLLGPALQLGLSPRPPTLPQRRSQSAISTRAWFSKHTVPDCHAPKDSNKFKWNSC